VGLTLNRLIGYALMLPPGLRKPWRRQGLFAMFQQEIPCDFTIRSPAKE
jgi:hypothetical protein